MLPWLCGAPGNHSGAHRTARLESADAEGLTHLTEADAGLLVLLRVRLAERLLAKATAPRLLTLQAMLTRLALLDQSQDRGRQRLLHGLLHRAAHALGQRRVQCDSQVRVRLVGQALLLQLLMDLLDLLQRLLHALRNLLTRLLTGLLDRLLDHLCELLLRATHLRAADLLAKLLQGGVPVITDMKTPFNATGKPT
ncbi:hypothetical protein [Streptomyces sp. AK02-04a]|uniref:hypothetical protein n=1 Tax=Streptomyces sp. AK02-04a TaxID=3028649 RepID=UPI0029AF4653|nr:hypothetical protein [Streptomyces sp. AK02-04a]MDX3761578.1 hypothetical protein [Streptomyces sp. AK02-04a]